MMENAVFLSVKREYDEIFYHKDKKECDFIVRLQGKISLAVQVTAVLSESNRERETQGLIEALEKYRLDKGTIITEDQEGELIIANKKISIAPIWRWLIENE